MIIRIMLTYALNVEEVGGRRESQRARFALSIGQRPMYKVVSLFAL